MISLNDAYTWDKNAGMPVTSMPPKEWMKKPENNLAACYCRAVRRARFLDKYDRITNKYFYKVIFALLFIILILKTIYNLNTIHNAVPFNPLLVVLYVVITVFAIIVTEQIMYNTIPYLLMAPFLESDAYFLIHSELFKHDVNNDYNMPSIEALDSLMKHFSPPLLDKNKHDEVIANACNDWNYFISAYSIMLHEFSYMLSDWTYHPIWTGVPDGMTS